VTSSPAQDVLARLLCRRQIFDGPTTSENVRLPREALIFGTCNLDTDGDSVFQLAKETAHIKIDLPLPVASGLKWEKAAKPTQGRELNNRNLAEALMRKAELTKHEWDSCGIKYLLTDDYIKSGDFYFRPAAEKSSFSKAQVDFSEFIKCQLKDTRRGPGLEGSILVTGEKLIQVSWRCFEECTPKVGTTSLRDAVRCASISQVLETQFSIDSEGKRSSSIFDFLDEPEDGWAVQHPKLRSLSLACYLCFGMRIIQRSAFFERCQQESEIRVQELVVQVQNSIVKSLRLGKCVVQTSNLKDNLFASVLAVATRHPLLCLGCDGTSKTMALENILLSQMQGKQSSSKLLQALPRVQTFHLQLSERSIAQQVTDLKKTIQCWKSGKISIPCIFMEEMSMADSGPNGPLRALHDLLDSHQTATRDIREVAPSVSGSSSHMRVGTGENTFAFLATSNYRSEKGASGIKWLKTGGTQSRPIGRDLANPRLAEELLRRCVNTDIKVEFTQQDWDAFGIKDLSLDDFVIAGGYLFKPDDDILPIGRALGNRFLVLAHETLAEETLIDLAVTVGMNKIPELAESRYRDEIASAIRTCVSAVCRPAGGLPSLVPEHISIRSLLFFSQFLARFHFASENQVEANQKLAQISAFAAHLQPGYEDFDTLWRKFCSSLCPNPNLDLLPNVRNIVRDSWWRYPTRRPLLFLYDNPSQIWSVHRLLLDIFQEELKSCSCEQQNELLKVHRKPWTFLCPGMQRIVPSTNSNFCKSQADSDESLHTMFELKAAVERGGLIFVLNPEPIVEGVHALLNDCAEERSTVQLRGAYENVNVHPSTHIVLLVERNAARNLHRALLSRVAVMNAGRLNLRWGCSSHEYCFKYPSHHDELRRHYKSREDLTTRSGRATHLPSAEWLKEEAQLLDDLEIPLDELFDSLLPRLPGLRWEESGTDKPSSGVEFSNAALAEALRKGKHAFTREEFGEFKLTSASFATYIKVQGKYFKPVGCNSLLSEKKGRLAIIGVSSGIAKGQRCFVPLDVTKNKSVICVDSIQNPTPATFLAAVTKAVGKLEIEGNTDRDTLLLDLTSASRVGIIEILTLLGFADVEYSSPACPEFLGERLASLAFREDRRVCIFVDVSNAHCCTPGQFHPWKKPTGRKWSKASSKPLSTARFKRIPFQNPELAAALLQKTQFTQAEVKAFGMSNLSRGSFVEVEDQGRLMYFKPVDPNMRSLVSYREVRETKRSFPDWPRLSEIASNPQKVWELAIDLILEFIEEYLDCSRDKQVERPGPKNKEESSEQKRKLANVGLRYFIPEKTSTRFFCQFEDATGERDVLKPSKRVDLFDKTLKKALDEGRSLRLTILESIREVALTVAEMLVRRVHRDWLESPDLNLISFLELLLSSRIFPWQERYHHPPKEPMEVPDKFPFFSDIHRKLYSDNDRTAVRDILDEAFPRLKEKKLGKDTALYSILAQTLIYKLVARHGVESVKLSHTSFASHLLLSVSDGSIHDMFEIFHRHEHWFVVACYLNAYDSQAAKPLPTDSDSLLPFIAQIIRETLRPHQKTADELHLHFLEDQLPIFYRYAEKVQDAITKSTNLEQSLPPMMDEIRWILSLWGLLNSVNTFSKASPQDSRAAVDTMSAPADTSMNLVLAKAEHAMR
jgi:hypothetical protein